MITLTSFDVVLFYYVLLLSRRKIRLIFISYCGQSLCLLILENVMNGLTKRQVWKGSIFVILDSAWKFCFELGIIVSFTHFYCELCFFLMMSIFVVNNRNVSKGGWLSWVCLFVLNLLLPFTATNIIMMLLACDSRIILFLF